MPFRLQLSNRFGNLFVFLQALTVTFEKIPENESADVCRNISVNVLDCDTIGQAKEKIFQAFLSKNGSPYGLQLNEIGLGKAIWELFCPSPLTSIPSTFPPSWPPACKLCLVKLTSPGCSQRACLEARRLHCSPTGIMTLFPRKQDPSKMLFFVFCFFFNIMFVNQIHEIANPETK